MKNGPEKELAAQIVKRLQREGFAAYFVGGWVRDRLMRRARGDSDIDIATSATPEQIKKLFPKRVYPVGAQFGTLLVLSNKIPFQVSSFRGKGKKFSQDIREDIKARDFTINGLAYDPLEHKIIDLVGAREDIGKKRIRSIGNPSLVFTQDPLRLLRAVRLAVSLGFSIEQNTAQGIKELAPIIKRSSKERIRGELNRIFTSERPGEGLRLLDQLGLLAEVLPQVDKLKGIKQPPAFHPEGDVFAHTLLMLEKLKKPSLVLAWACLLHDIGKPSTFAVSDRIRFSGHDKVGTEICQRLLSSLRFTKKDIEDITACVENHMRMMETPKMRESTLKRLFFRRTFEVELKLHRIDCIASHRDLSIFRFLRKKYKEFKKRPPTPKPLLSGHELIKMGFTPGPIFGKIHNQMLDLQLEGKIKTKAQAARWLEKQFKGAK